MLRNPKKRYVQVNVRERMRAEQSDNTTSFRLNSTSAPAASMSKRKYIILTSSAPPSSWVDWVWPVFWPAVTVVYLIDVNVFYPLYLINQAMFSIGRVFT